MKEFYTTTTTALASIITVSVLLVSANCIAKPNEATKSTSKTATSSPKTISSSKHSFTQVYKGTKVKTAGTYKVKSTTFKVVNNRITTRAGKVTKVGYVYRGKEYSKNVKLVGKPKPVPGNPKMVQVTYSVPTPGGVQYISFNVPKRFTIPKTL